MLDDALLAWNAASEVDGRPATPFAALGALWPIASAWSGDGERGHGGLSGSQSTQLVERAIRTQGNGWLLQDCGGDQDR